MELPDCNSKYSRKDYWEERFAVEKEFNWLGGLSHYVDVLDARRVKSLLIGFLLCKKFIQ